MTDRFRLTLGQMNPTAGDLSGNAALARQAWEAGRAAQAQMVALPELFLTGAVGDLLRSPAFLRDAQAQLETLARACADGPALGIGAPWQEGDRLYNAYLILEEGRITQRVLKHRLAAEEAALFDAGPISGPYVVAGLRLGSPIGADIADADVAETLEETGAEVLLSPHAAPYRRGILDLRFNHTVARVIETGLPLIYLNQIGAEGREVCDGASFALNPGGHLARQLPAFETAVAHIDLARGAEGWHVLPGEIAAQTDATEKDYRALVLGLRDHLRKSGQSNMLLGLEGDAGSALVAALAADAMGPAQLRCVFLPGPETPDAARGHAEFTAAQLGCTLDVAPLATLQSQLGETLGALKGAEAQGGLALTDGVRRLLLQTLGDDLGAMALSNASKTDAALGRPSAQQGGLAPISDLYESEVLTLCQWRNRQHRAWMNGPAGAVMPSDILSATPDAPDIDSLLKLLLEDKVPPADCIAAGYEEAVVEKLAEQVFHASRIAAPGPQISDAKPMTAEGLAAQKRWLDSR
ncbi:nitrilase-related carbon-nitrogen hydrolase [Sulfitobacter sp. PS-8MA]|uniref:nitrilase-related carbon-nitrogen hydrolase n=1 Tax=Sulfitobacter sp. PS-8MA TaxID=3237707 RepID=UPI0034C5BE74